MIPPDVLTLLKYLSAGASGGLLMAALMTRRHERASARAFYHHARQLDLTAERQRNLLPTIWAGTYFKLEPFRQKCGRYKIGQELRLTPPGSEPRVGDLVMTLTFSDDATTPWEVRLYRLINGCEDAPLGWCPQCKDHFETNGYHCPKCETILERNG